MGDEPELRGVFFDLDDTLYPYPPCNEAGKRAALAAARDRGYDLDREAFDALYRRGRRATKRELSGTAAAHERYLYLKRAVERHAGEPRPADALALGEAYWDGFVGRMEPFDGVKTVLAATDEAGLSTAIVTNLTTRIQLRKLVALGIEERFDEILTSEEIGREKPSAAAFTRPLAALGLRPSETLMVGDDPESDVEGANAVGLRTALVNSDATQVTGLRRPDHRLDTVAEVSEVFA